MDLHTVSEIARPTSRAALGSWRDALARGGGLDRPGGEAWREGRGVALAIIACAPPTEHRSEARLSLEADGRYHLAIGSPEFGNGSTTVRHQIVATVLGTFPSGVGSTLADATGIRFRELPLTPDRIYRVIYENTHFPQSIPTTL